MWATKAADQELPDAQLLLGQIYRGNNAKRNLNKALMWFKRAAQQGDRDAQYQLGQMLEEEEDVRDPEKAKHWYEVAYRGGHIEAEDAYKNFELREYCRRKRTDERATKNGMLMRIPHSYKILCRR